MRNRLCLFLLFCSFLLTASAQVQFFPPLQQAPFVIEGSPEGRVSMDVGILIVDRLTGKYYSKTTTRAINTGWVEVGTGGGGTGSALSFSGQFTVTASTNISLASGANVTNLTGSSTFNSSAQVEHNLGTIAGAGTATLSLATNLYRAIFSGSTFSVDLPASPSDGSWATIVGTNTSGATQIGTIKVATVATAIWNEKLKAAVSTFVNRAAGAFTIRFRASNGTWIRLENSSEVGVPLIISPSPTGATNWISDFTVPVNRVTLTNDVFFQYSTNYTDGVLSQVLWILDPNGTNRAIGFNASWKFNNTPPAYTGTNLFFVLSLTAHGVGETNVLAAYQTYQR